MRKEEIRDLKNKLQKMAYVPPPQPMPPGGDPMADMPMGGPPMGGPPPVGGGGPPMGGPPPMGGGGPPMGGPPPMGGGPPPGGGGAQPISPEEVLARVGALEQKIDFLLSVLGIGGQGQQQGAPPEAPPQGAPVSPPMGGGAPPGGMPAGPPGGMLAGPPGMPPKMSSADSEVARLISDLLSGE